MSTFFEAGPFSARGGEGRELFSGAVIRLPEAKAVLLEGPSGSGKSTLLRHVAALDGGAGRRRNLSGEMFSGNNLPTWRSRVTLMAQDAPMVPGSVQDNLEFPYRLRAAPANGFEIDRASELMADVGLHVPFARNVATLSGGERHRLALVRGLLWDPSVMLADEPLSGLDPDAASTCLNLLLLFARRPGHGVILALHDPDLGARADVKLVLRNGRLEET